jgi:hypothetical protein
MAVTDVNGTQTATINTEHTLADTAAAGTYVLRVDLVNMAKGDVLELRMKVIVLTGDTVPGEVEYYARFTDAQPADNRQAISVPVSTPLTTSGAIRATLKQTAGTGRSYKWSLMKFA